MIDRDVIEAAARALYEHHYGVFWVDADERIKRKVRRAIAVAFSAARKAQPAFFSHPY